MTHRRTHIGRGPQPDNDLDQAGATLHSHSNRLYQNAHLANDGNWLTEGVASLVQMRLYPASADRRQWAELARNGQ